MFHLFILIIIVYYFVCGLIWFAEKYLSSPEIHFPWEKERPTPSKTTLKITINSDDSSVDAKPLNKPVHSGRAVHNGKELKIDKK
ncbi:MAG: hypothetical protein LBG92_12395 [Prevotellaceae bacterium]|jgi:hypothetical protein|nr:hypothetical protein [Prevotellaceae bacterium]